MTGGGASRTGRRFPALPGARPSRLALTSVGLVIAAVIGVQLGQSAISDINPIHFQGPLERPQAITPPPEPAPYDPYARQYVWTMPPDPTLAGCVASDCGAAETRMAVQLAMDESAGRDPALPPWRDATPNTELRPWQPGEVPGRGRGVEHYMHYPVSREQAEAIAAEAAQPAVTAVAATPAETLRPPAVVPTAAAGE